LTTIQIYAKKEAICAEETDCPAFAPHGRGDTARTRPLPDCLPRPTCLSATLMVIVIDIL
jgi:hypothetical protein